ncbi:MAG: hypothetical protein IJD57_07705 [Candidatus Gastranaerophilales bacterium]|nr:hypothetical protein [Candidatus Gastranaerophilales bacterium]
MSFDFGPMQNLSNVQASHKSCAGGGGNTGYFQRGKKDEDEALLNFNTEEYPPDSFEHMELDLEEEKKDFWTSVKLLFKKIFSALKRLISK